MEAGKIEFAPDYKSKFDAAMHEGAKMAEGILDTLKQSGERERLRDEVIEAAKVWLHTEHSTAPESSKIDSRSRLSRAVSALDSFEAEQKT